MVVRSLLVFANYNSVWQQMHTLSSKITAYGEMRPLIWFYSVCWTVSWISAKCFNKFVTWISLPTRKDSLMPPLCLPPFGFISEGIHVCIRARRFLWITQLLLFPFIHRVKGFFQPDWILILFQRITEWESISQTPTESMLWVSFA